MGKLAFYRDLIGQKLNARILENKGDMRDGIHNDKRRRPLFVCVIRKVG